jgi:hypothetical protein
MSKNWEIVVSYMHYSGEDRGRLSEVQDLEIRLRADGFGELRNEYKDAIGDDEKLGRVMDKLYDWSHIRDSGPEAVTSMAQRIKLFKT